MKIKNSIVYIFLLEILCYCSFHKEEVGLMHIRVPDVVNSSIKLSEISDSITRLDLQSNEKVFLGYIFDVKFANNKLFIVEASRISIFDIDGKFIQFLGKYGEGPGEYHRIKSLDIDEESGLIYLSSYNKILVYNLEFDLVNERKLDFPVQYLKVLNDELYVLSEEVGLQVNDKFLNKTQFLKLDKSFNVLDSLPFRSIYFENKQVGGYPFRFWLSDLNDDYFLYVPVLTPENFIRDTLYQVKDGSIIPSVRFEFERGQSLNANGYQTLLLYNIFNSNSYYILEYDIDWKRYMFLYDKRTKENFNFEGGIYDHVGDIVFLRPLDLSNDIFYYIKEVKYIKNSGVENNPEVGIVKLK